MKTGHGGRMNRVSGENGFTFMEVLAVVLLLGILALIALPNYFGAATGTQNAVRSSNVSVINTAVSLFQYRNNGLCPGQGGAPETFAQFLSDATYFPDGQPAGNRTVHHELQHHDLPDKLGQPAQRGAWGT